MNKKIIIIIVSVIMFLVSVGIILGIIISKKRRPDCTSISGGSFNLVFDTNGGNPLKTMRVCVACSPDSYDELPTPEKDAYQFSGWYYDSGFKKKVESIVSIQPVANTDKNGCFKSYKDIKIYAKWSEEAEESK